MRHAELDYFKDMLETRKEQIIKNITSVNDELAQLRDMDLNDEGDYASVNSDDLVESAIGEQQHAELKEIEVALDKLKQGTYGICDMCEEDIGIHRLKVKPHAKFCIDCREIAEKNNK